MIATATLTPTTLPCLMMIATAFVASTRHAPLHLQCSPNTTTVLWSGQELGYGDDLTYKEYAHVPRAMHGRVKSFFYALVYNMMLATVAMFVMVGPAVLVAWLRARVTVVDPGKGTTRATMHMHNACGDARVKVVMHCDLDPGACVRACVRACVGLCSCESCL